jgi:glycine/D-amino acid oxidase-like deaminating enzyme
MDLKSGCPIWSAVDGPSPQFAPLAQDVRCDIAVIGAGITGALLADRLVREGHDVILVDRRAICSGSTVASTGLLQYEIDVPLIEMANKVGVDHAQRAYRASYRALHGFEKLVAGLDDDAALTPRSSLYLATQPTDVPALLAEAAARRAIGIEVDFLDEAALAGQYGIHRPAALRSARALDVDPVRLTRSLLRRAVRNGVRIYGHTPIGQYESRTSDVVLTTGQGNTIGATRTVFATGYETPEFVDRDLCVLKSTYAFASRPLAALWPQGALIWERGNPYLYLRATRDGRAMVGGEDDDFDDPDKRDAQVESKCRILLQKCRKLLPDLAMEPEYRWAGTFAQTADGLPYIGRLPQFERGYFALGYGGNGITFSLIAAGIIADQIARRDNPDAELFRFDR